MNKLAWFSNLKHYVSGSRIKFGESFMQKIFLTPYNMLAKEQWITWTEQNKSFLCRPHESVLSVLTLSCQQLGILVSHSCND